MVRLTVRKLIQILKSDGRDFIKQSIRRFLALRHPYIFYRTLKGIKLVVAPNDSWLFFLYTLLFWAHAMRSRRYYKNIDTSNYTVHTREFFDQALASGHPVLVVHWQHGARGLEKLLIALATTFNVSSYEASDVNKINTSGKNYIMSLVRIRNILAANTGAVTIAFDGPDGNRDIPVKNFGEISYMGHGYSAMVKMFKPIVIPVTKYMTDRREIEIYFNQPLFTDTELETFDEKQIIERTIDFFTNDLLKHGRYQIAYYKLFRYRLDDIKSGRNLR